jgi:cysteine synthase A
MIDLTLQPDRRKRAIQRARERNIIIPTYKQMKNPALIPDKVKAGLKNVGLWDVNPLNLFRINGRRLRRRKLSGIPQGIDGRQRAHLRHRG